MTNQRTLIAGVVVLVGIIALVIGVIYLTVEAKSLPSVLGQIKGSTVHRSHRGIAGIVIGVVLILGGAGYYFYKPGPRDPTP